MTDQSNKWVPSGQSNEVGQRKQVRLLIIGDEAVEEGGSYYGQLKECAELCRHLFDITCNVAASGESGMKLIQGWEPTVVLLEAHLSDISSLDILRCGNENSIPVVVTSHYRSHEIEETFTQGGAAAYLPKTDDPDDFEQILHKIVNVASEAKITH
ncbi:MAG: response regulator [Deltaproteobacteria bacterium]|nr:response regulator [Deltaproteobacteria bacterium]